MDVFTVGCLVVLCWDVALLLQILRADLRDMHIDQVSVVSIDLHHLIGVLAVNVDVVVGADMLVRQDRLWLAVLVAWSIHVGNLQVASLLLLIDLEEEVLLGDHLVVGILSKLFSANLIFEFDKTDLLLHNFVDSLANLSEVLRASRFTQWLIGAWLGRILFQGVQIGSLGLVFLSNLLHRLCRVLPQCHNVIRRCGNSLTDGGNLARESTLNSKLRTALRSQKHLEHLVLSTDHI